MTNVGPPTASRICPLCREYADILVCRNDGYLTVSTKAVNPAPDLTGKIFGSSFVLDQLMSDSATAQIYAGRQLSLGRKVAVKIRKNCDARHLRGISRFQREGRTLALFSDHPRIVDVIELGVTTSGTFWLVQEFLVGRALGALIPRGAFGPEVVLAVSACIADALSAIHAHKIVHRNVNPASIYVERGGETGASKLLGFNLVKLASDDDPVADSKPVTRKGQIVGDPRYLAPEQAMGGEVTAATDVYALGLTMYEMLTSGASPFKDSSSGDLVVARLTEKPAPPMLDGRRLRGAVVDLVMSFIAKSPGSRVADGQAALDAIRACQKVKASKQLYAK